MEYIRNSNSNSNSNSQLISLASVFEYFVL